jgi:transcription initiation factor IIF auxiliary subunit
VLSRWFHCVKLPVDVIQSDQPFNALFPTNDAEHLFVSSVDGFNRIPLESDTSRPELWAAMSKVLAASYAKDPVSAAKEIQRAHARLDLLDARLHDLERNRDDVLEGQLDKDKVKKLEKEIEATKKDLDNERQSIDRLSKLDLKISKKAERS